MEILINGILFVFLYIHFAIVLNCIIEGIKEVKKDLRSFFKNEKEIYLFEILIFVIVYLFVMFLATSPIYREVLL